ncbi:MAG: hypothetical protein LBV12_05145, partial [Puniceicoccales bacterium]|nr:hypothetical protein [Puniceicoccales bacterium]
MADKKKPLKSAAKKTSKPAAKRSVAKKPLKKSTPVKAVPVKKPAPAAKKVAPKKKAPPAKAPASKAQSKKAAPAPKKSPVKQKAPKVPAKNSKTPAKETKISAKKTGKEKASSKAPVTVPRSSDATDTAHAKEQEVLNEKIGVLVRTSKEKGFITIQDINQVAPESASSPEVIENIMNILDNLKVQIIDEDDVESYKQKQEESEEEAAKTANVDILDDPVRMYLKQMGQVPLLTREQEVEISKRIETAEIRALDFLFSVWITLPFQLDIAKKLISKEERFDRVVLDKKVESRDAYFKGLPKSIEGVEEIFKKLEKAWNDYLTGANEKVRGLALKRFTKLEGEIRPLVKKFCFKTKIFEEWL